MSSWLWSYLTLKIFLRSKLSLFCVSFKWLTFKFKHFRLRSLAQLIWPLFSVLLSKTWDVYFILNLDVSSMSLYNYNKQNIMWQLEDTNCIYAALAREKYHQQAMIKFVFPARSCNILYISRMWYVQLTCLACSCRSLLKIPRPIWLISIFSKTISLTIRCIAYRA